MENFLKTADYSAIAKVYDKNPIRLQYDPEPHIGRLLSSTNKTILILDVACGTGNFLLAQTEYFPDKRIKWHGCDLSLDMLSISKAKLANGIELTTADAADLPYPNEQFDFVTCNFAFHHFQGKVSCISQFHRILKPGGVFQMKNICPEAMPLSWVYHYFKAARKIDRQRFWSNDHLRKAFAKCGFSVELTTTITEKAFPLTSLLEEARNRDMSQLNLLSEKEYRKGLARIQSATQTGDFYEGNFALLKLCGAKVTPNG